MRKTCVVLGLSLAVLLTGCGDDRGSRQPDDTGPAAAPDAPPTPPLLTRKAQGRLGPIHFEYDFSELALVEVPVGVPPGYRDSVFGQKLIPAARAKLLGERQCQYGQSTRLQTCRAADEPGLVLALLERPLADYRQAFTDQDAAERLAPASLDGAQGFGFIARTDGSGTEYRFLPVEDRTLLMARKFASGNSEDPQAIQDVIHSIERELEALERR